MFGSKENLLIREITLLLVLLLSMEGSRMIEASSDLNGTRIFTRTPGHVRVMEKTKALLDWRHSIKNIREVNGSDGTITTNVVYVSWFDVGTTQHKKFDLIMAYAYDQGRYIAPTDKSTRLSYIPGEDSAAMELGWVTDWDDGRYEVRVIDPLDKTPGGFYIADTASLESVKWSALTFAVTLKNETFPFAVAPGASNFLLPNVSIPVHDRLFVMLSIDQGAPPADINMATSIGNDMQRELPCSKSHVCERDIPIHTKEVDTADGVVEISLDFGVQNLPVVYVNIPLNVGLSLEQVAIKEQSSKDAMVIVFGILLCVLAVFVLGLAIVYRHKLVIMVKRCKVKPKDAKLEANPDHASNTKTNPDNQSTLLSNK